MTSHYSATTRGVVVGVQTVYLSEQSDPEADTWVWAYQVRIENRGPETVQLLRRTWHITDARGRTQTVEGPGVVGKTPTLRPGEAFEYSSGTPLATASGFMSGLYHMVVPATGEAFDADIPNFSLDAPAQGGSIH